MKDIFLLTDRPIVWSDCKTAILSVFPNAKGDNSMLLIGQSPKTLQIWFDAGENNRLYNQDESGSDFPASVKEQITLDNPYCTNIEFHRERDICKLLSVLLPLYPEMVLIDDDDRVFGGKQYLTQYGNGEDKK